MTRSQLVSGDLNPDQFATALILLTLTSSLRSPNLPVSLTRVHLTFPKQNQDPIPKKKNASLNLCSNSESTDVDWGLLGRQMLWKHPEQMP